MSPVLKRNLGRGLLVLHLLGLALSLGTRAADFALERLTGHDGLQTLAFGRDLTNTLARGLVLPGFLLLVVTGIAMALLRFGWRAPLWVWIKLGVAITAFGVAVLAAAPAVETARRAALWSAAHGQAAPELHADIRAASLYGAVVLVLFVVNILVAVWKPVRRP